MVAQSIAFAYAPTGTGLKSEDDPLLDDAPWPWSRSVQALHELEDTVTQTEGIEGVVLRYGFFYGPGSAYARDGHFAREVRRRRFPIVGKGSGVFSFIHVDDAAAATVAAMERGHARHLQRRRRRARADARMAARLRGGGGGEAAAPRAGAGSRGWWPAATPPAMATQLRGASNEKAKASSAGSRATPSWRQGFREALG